MFLILLKIKVQKWEDAIKYIDQKYLFNIDLINWFDQIEYKPYFYST